MENVSLWQRTFLVLCAIIRGAGRIHTMGMIRKENRLLLFNRHLSEDCPVFENSQAHTEKEDRKGSRKARILQSAVYRPGERIQVSSFSFPVSYSAWSDAPDTMPPHVAVWQAGQGRMCIPPSVK